jgi:hypothetical protein
LSRAAAGKDLLAVANAYAELGEAAAELAGAVEFEDRAARPIERKKARRSA